MARTPVRLSSSHDKRVTCAFQQSPTTVASTNRSGAKQSCATQLRCLRKDERVESSMRGRCCQKL